MAISHSDMTLKAGGSFPCNSFAATAALAALVHQHAIERSVETVVVDLVLGDAEQIIEGRLAIERLGDVQVARRHAQAADHVQRREIRPANVLAPFGHQAIERFVELQRVPQAQAEEHVAEAARAFDPHGLQLDLLDIRELVLTRLEQARVCSLAREFVGVSTSSAPALRVQLAELRHDLLADLAVDAHRPHQHPVGVRLAVPSDALVAEEHVR
jgi:hypothetical protein